MQDSNRQIRLGAVISYSTLFVNIILSLLYTPWMVAQIGKSNYALYTLATSFISLFMMDFGLSAGVSKYVAQYRAEGRKNDIGRLLSTAGFLYVIADIVILTVLTVCYFLLDTIYKGLTPNELQTYRGLFLIVAVYSIVSFPFLPLSGILNSYEKFIQQKLCELFQKLFSVALTIISLLMGAGVQVIVISNAVSGVITIVLKLLIISKKTGITFDGIKFDVGLLKQICAFSLWSTIGSLAQRCIFSLAPTILGVVSTSTEIAVFAPANALEGYFYTIAAAVNGLFLPKILRYISNNEENKIMPLMIKVGKYQLFVLGFIYVGFLCIGGDFMTAWMGQDYVNAWPCALMLFLPDILLFSQQIASTTVIAKDMIKYNALGNVIMAAICVIMSFILCPRLGVFGTCFSIMSGYSVLFFYQNILYQKKLGLNMKHFFKTCYFKMLFPMAVAAGISWLICSYIPYSGWLAVVAKGGIVTVIYLPVMVAAMGKEGRAMMLDALQRIKTF